MVVDIGVLVIEFVVSPVFHLCAVAVPETVIVAASPWHTNLSLGMPDVSVTAIVRSVAVNSSAPISGFVELLV
jgi:hypothetical protein